MSTAGILELATAARLALPGAIMNVLRQRRRTAAGAIAVTFGIVAFILAGGFIEWMFWAMREGVIKANIGHVQISRPGYLQSGMADPFSFLMPDSLPEQKTIAQAEHVQVLSPRLSFSGLISVGETSASYIGDGVDPELEAKVSSGLRISKGKALDPAEPKGIIVGEGLAHNIGAEIGSKVVLLGNTRSGGVSAVEVTVLGLFTSATKAYDDTALRVPIALARQLLKVSGSHRWVLLLDDTSNTTETVESLRSRLDPKAFEVTPWTALADFYNKTRTLFSRQVTFIQFIIAAIIMLSISNTMLMNVMERTGEIGTAMALGMTRRDILIGFVLEGTLLGTLGGLVGLVLGLVLARVVSEIGIPMPAPPGLSHAFIGEILVTPSLAVHSLILAFVTTLLASLYPAWKASKLVIVDALRRNR